MVNVNAGWLQNEIPVGHHNPKNLANAHIMQIFYFKCNMHTNMCKSYDSQIRHLGNTTPKT
jgi:hypothetical protein